MPKATRDNVPCCSGGTSLSLALSLTQSLHEVKCHMTCETTSSQYLVSQSFTHLSTSAFSLSLFRQMGPWVKRCTYFCPQTPTIPTPESLTSHTHLQVHSTPYPIVSADHPRQPVAYVPGLLYRRIPSQRTRKDQYSNRKPSISPHLSKRH